MILTRREKNFPGYCILGDTAGGFQRRVPNPEAHAQRHWATPALRNVRHSDKTHPMADEQHALAWELFQKAYEMQTQGELEMAVDLYRRSIEIQPTAEAHTFLGWTYHVQGRLDDAISECKKAIAVDPSFGNPYNDIGAYLIEKGELDEAIDWLEQALASRRYDAYHYAWYNLGRIYVARELFNKARECFRNAIEIEPRYWPADEALRKLKTLLQ
jgi:tetratricopeptide (TPR) repeat protein